MILETTKKLNEHTLELVKVYLNRLIDLTNRSRGLVDDIVSDAKVTASKIQKLTVPLKADTPCQAGYVLVNGICGKI